MAETASLELTKDQAEAFLDQLSHDSRIQFARAAYKALAEIDSELLESLSLEELNIGQIESGQKPQFICPHVGCEQSFNPDKLREFSFHLRRENPARVLFGDPQIGNGRVDMYRQGDDDGEDWRVASFICPECDRPVALPIKWTVAQY